MTNRGSAKKLALEAVGRVPEDASLEDIMERLYLLAKIERGRADVTAGRVVSQDEVRKRFGL